MLDAIFGMEAAIMMIDGSAMLQMRTSAMRLVWSSQLLMTTGRYNVLMPDATPALLDS